MNQSHLVKIFGERNTSTNAIKQLIEKNSASKILPSVAKEIDKNFALKNNIISILPNARFIRERYIDTVFHEISPLYSWKHTATFFTSAKDFFSCFVIFTVRHPASWLLAMHRRPYHALQPVPSSFRDFITTKWKTAERDSLGKISCTPIDLYNYKASSYLDFMAKLDSFDIKYSLVYFEIFASDQQMVFDSIKPYLNNPKNDLVFIERSTKERTKNRAYYQNYYANRLWLGDVNDSDKDYIDQKVNWEIAQKFGYEPLKKLR